MKRIIKFIIGVVIICVSLVGLYMLMLLYNYSVEVKEAKQLEALSKMNWKDLVFNVNEGWEVDESLLVFYETMEEALQRTGNGMFTGISYARNVDQELKRMENDEYGMIFYLSSLDENKGISMSAKFKIRKEDGKRQYALFIIEPVEVRKGAKPMGTFEEVIQGQLKFNDYYGVNGINQNQRFMWGISTSKDIYKLAVEGQKPTEIIPYEFLGETEYFWYFEDIKSTKPGAALEIKVDEK